MADDPTPQRPEPASDAKKHAIKRVVLSSVAKLSENGEDSLLGAPDPTKTAPPLSAKMADDGLIRPVGWTTRPGGTTTIIKLPPKTGVLPRLTSLARKQGPPPLPGQPVLATTSEEETKGLTPIKIKPPASAPADARDSIFPTAASPAIEVKPIAARQVVPPPLPPRTDKKSPLVPTAATGPLKNTVQLKKAPGPIGAPPAKTIPPVDAHHVAHVPRLVPADAPTREAEAEVKAGTSAKAEELARTTKLTPPPPPLRRLPDPVASLPIPDPEKAKPTETIRLERVNNKHRLPPRANATVRLPTADPEPEKPLSRATGPVVTPPKVYPITPPSTQIKADDAPAGPRAPAAVTPKRATVTPPTIPLNPGTGTVKPPTIPLKPAPAFVPSSAFLRATEPITVDEPEEPGVPSSRAARKRKRRLIGVIVFYVFLAGLLPALYFAALHFTQETRVEGQVIPPHGMELFNEAWIVTDFRSMATGVANDLGDNRQIILQDMQEKMGHVQRARADVATREARIRLLKDQIQADNDEELSLVKQARAAAQQVWDGPGAGLESDYQSRLNSLNHAIADRAKANHLKYDPDPNFYSPEVWSNAYRLALYEVPPGLDPVKERAWLDQQMKAWHAFTKAVDQKNSELRDKSAQLKLAPATKVADLKQQIGDLQQRIDGTIAEEEPLKAELEQAQTDLKVVQDKEAALDAKPYSQLDALPEQNIIDRLRLHSNGRFSWRDLQQPGIFGADETTHVFWIFVRAYRTDGRQYWSLHRFNVDKNSTTELTVEPESFVSTRAILRPDLSPDEQAR